MLFLVHEFTHVHLLLFPYTTLFRSSMVNNINAFELSDEQLDTVTGAGDSFRFISLQGSDTVALHLNLAAAPTGNFSGINFGSLSQSGAIILQGNSSKQNAENH